MYVCMYVCMYVIYNLMVLVIHINVYTVTYHCKSIYIYIYARPGGLKQQSWAIKNIESREPWVQVDQGGKQCTIHCYGMLDNASEPRAKKQSHNYV